MSDLVSDLRNPDVAAGTPAMVMRNQAADEIKRLRAALDAVHDPTCRHQEENHDPLTGECLTCARTGKCPLYHVIFAAPTEEANSG